MRRRSAAWWVAGLVACGAPADGPTDDTDTDTDVADETDVDTDTDTDGSSDTDTDVDTDDPFAPVWDAARQAELKEAILVVADRIGTFDGVPVDAAITRLGTLLVPECNTVRTDGDTVTWSGTCVADGRSTFGVLSRTGLVASPFEAQAADDVIWAIQALTPGWTLPPGAVVAGDGFDADGIFFVEQDGELLARVNGPYEERRGRLDGYFIRHTRLGGPAVDVGAEAGSWVADGLVPEFLEITRVRGTATVVQVDGAMSGWPGPVIAVDLQEVVLANGGTLCATEPYGTWGLLHEDGTWYEVAFDADTACDGCGTVTAAERVLGTVCPGGESP